MEKELINLIERIIRSYMEYFKKMNNDKSLSDLLNDSEYKKIIDYLCEMGELVNKN